jgi:hypothetical protein
VVAGSPVVRDGTGPTAWCGLPGVWSVRAALFLGPGGDGLRRRDGAVVGRRGHLAPDVRMQGGGARQLRTSFLRERNRRIWSDQAVASDIVGPRTFGPGRGPVNPARGPRQRSAQLQISPGLLPSVCLRASATS